MLCEFSGINNMAVFVHPNEVAAVEQKKKHCFIYLNSGVQLTVKESAAEVSNDIKYLSNELMMMGAALGNMSNV